jgi:type IV secretory pathway VirB2 component (pilin)
MTTSAARHHARRAGRTGKSAGRKAAQSPALRWLARAGLAARGVLYLIIGWIAIQVAFGQSSHQADQTGALRLLGRNPAGEVALWLLVIGFAGMCLWRVTEAIYGASGPDGDKATARLAALGRALVYGFITFGVLKYAVGLGAPKSSDQQSVDLTATVMSHPGGRVAVIIVGVALAGGGLALAYSAARSRFLKKLNTGEMSPRTRTVVTWLGRLGGVARGAIFVVAGIFLILAAAEAKPHQAKGLDTALRALTRTPLGPWLLLVVAIGLIMFGVFSCCEARWRRVQLQPQDASPGSSAPGSSPAREVRLA